jgi:hypothetical protein
MPWTFNISLRQSSIEGTGMFANRPFYRGQFIGSIKGPEIRMINTTERDALDNPNWVGYAPNGWIDPLAPFDRMNHSCDPNCGIKGKRSVHALRDIEAGEELTLDYSTTEIDPRWRMVCNCKTAACRGLVGSILTLPPEIVLSYLPFVPAAMAKIYIRERLHGVVADRYTLVDRRPGRPDWGSEGPTSSSASRS